MLLYCIVWHCIVLYCIVLYCTVLYCIVCYCIVLYCTALYVIVLYCIVLYCIVLYCIVLYCIVLYCINKTSLRLFLQIEYTTLGDITVKTEIHYDPDASTTVIEEDKEFVDEYLLLEGEKFY